ncbi:MAG: hypothetical protein JNL18_02525 [Planctomycetaceae bacterium]|nr:hypothetical protein [Planctomycetaceae bacterium]
MISLGLATLYGVVGVMGYSLHSFVGCQASVCHDGASAGVAAGSADAGHDCCCHHHNHSSGKDASQSKQNDAAFRAAKSGHHPDNCSLCALLAQLKVSHAAVEQVNTAQQFKVELAIAVDSVFSMPPIRLGDARGPPMQVA